MPGPSPELKPSEPESETRSRMLSLGLFFDSGGCLGAPRLEFRLELEFESGLDGLELNCFGRGGGFDRGGSIISISDPLLSGAACFLGVGDAE